MSKVAKKFVVTDRHRDKAKRIALEVREAASRVSATKLTRGNVNIQYGRFKVKRGSHKTSA